VDVFQNQTTALSFRRFPYSLYYGGASDLRGNYTVQINQCGDAVVVYVYSPSRATHTDSQCITYTQIRTHPHLYFYHAAHRFIDTPRRHRRTHTHPITLALPPRPLDYHRPSPPRGQRPIYTRVLCRPGQEAMIPPTPPRRGMRRRCTSEGEDASAVPRFFFSVPLPVRGRTRDGECARPFIELPLPPP